MSGRAKNMTIELIVNYRHCREAASPLHWEYVIARKLQAAGVPINPTKGMPIKASVVHGKLRRVGCKSNWMVAQYIWEEGNTL